MKTIFIFLGDLDLYIVYIGYKMSRFTFESWLSKISSCTDAYRAGIYCRHPYPAGSTLKGRLLFFMKRFTGSTFCHQSLSICLRENSDFLLRMAFAKRSFSKFILYISNLRYTVEPFRPPADIVEPIVLLSFLPTGPGVWDRDWFCKSEGGGGSCLNCLSNSSLISLLSILLIS
jgi:hypothetical protein